jgi:hypothetical protein
MTNGNVEPWVVDGEKYALVGLEVELEWELRSEQIAPNLWALSGPEFRVPAHWREWIGSIRVNQVERCNLFLLSKLASAKPEILDSENKQLKERVHKCYLGLLLASRLAPRHRPVILTESRRDGDIGVRQHQDLECPVPRIFGPYPAVGHNTVKRAAHLGENLGLLAKTPPPGTAWRLFRVLDIFFRARTMRDPLDRLHQYCRCIEGLILPEAGETKRQFKSRTELFIGPTHHELMGQIYDIRSAVEHVHENQFLQVFDRALRLDIARKEAIAEDITRTAIARIIENPQLSSHFANDVALAKFWNRAEPERRLTWGNPIDPLEDVAGFDPSRISDEVLGA